MLVPKNLPHTAPWLRVLATVLFILGIPWALIAWMAIAGAPGAAVEDVMVGIKLHDAHKTWHALIAAPVFLLFGAQAAWGYAIWWCGWLRVATGRRASAPRFWLLAALHHLIWGALPVVCLALAAKRTTISPPEKFFMAYAVPICLICGWVAWHKNQFAAKKPRVAIDAWTEEI